MSKKGIIATVFGGGLASLGTLGAVLAASTTCIPCAIPVVGFILTVLGTVGITVNMLITKSIYFLAIGLVTVAIGITFIVRRYKNQVCEVKPKETKNPKEKKKKIKKKS